MSLLTVMMILAAVSFTILILLIFTILKGVGFGMLFKIFKAKNKRRKGWGFVRLINQTGIPQVIPYQFTGKELLMPEGEDNGQYIFKQQCLSPNEFDIPTITFRKGDADPIDPRTGLQTVTSARMVEQVVARAIRAESMLNGDPMMEWLKKNWMKIGLGIMVVIGAFLFLYMHMTDAIVEAGKSASSTIVLNASSLGK